jgi:hypothetical protein
MRLALTIPVCACLLLVSGCGPSGLFPEGQILKNGEPFIPGEGEFVQVALVSVADGGGSYVAGFSAEDGTFLVTDKGMPPGKYKVSIQVMKKRKDMLKGKVGPTMSPFVFDIQTGKEEIKVDLAQAGLEPSRKSGPARSRHGS